MEQTPAWRMHYLTIGTVLRYTVSGIFVILYFILKYIFSSDVAAADAISEIVKVIELILSGAMSYVDFAVAELLFYALIALLIIYILYIFVKLLRTKNWLPIVLRAISNLCLFFSSVAIIFMLLFGVQYYTTSLGDHMNLSVRPRSVAELTEVSQYVLEKANYYSKYVPRDSDGFCDYGSFKKMAGWVANGYTKLADEYPFFKSSYAAVKPVKSWPIMSAVGIAGIYIPYTGEALVNPDTPAPGLVFDMAHEVAHRLGVAPEDEANFSAYMACRYNTDRRVNYSAYFMAFRYLFNALYAQDAEAATVLWNQMTPELNRDMEQLNNNIERYESPVRDFGDKVNDTYLKINGQESGLKSYGKMVDLLMAEYFKEEKND